MDNLGDCDKAIKLLLRESKFTIYNTSVQLCTKLGVDRFVDHLIYQTWFCVLSVALASFSQRKMFFFLPKYLKTGAWQAITEQGVSNLCLLNFSCCHFSPFLWKRHLWHHLIRCTIECNFRVNDENFQWDVECHLELSSKKIMVKLDSTCFLSWIVTILKKRVQFSLLFRDNNETV